MSQSTNSQKPLAGKPGKTYLTIQSARAVRISGDVAQFTVFRGENGITKLASELNSYEVGGYIRPKVKSTYKVNIISGLSDAYGRPIAYDLAIANLNLSSIFAAPMLGGKRDLFLWDTLFVNAFIGTPWDDDVIALLYRFSGDPLFLRFESALCAFRTFKYKIDTDPSHVLFVFSVPDGARASFEYLKNSQYSKMDDFVKLKILDYHAFNMDGQTAKILFKSELLKKDLEDKLDCVIPAENELHSALSMDLEIFNPDYYYTPKSVIEKSNFNVKST